MTTRRLGRRAILRGAGVSLALPWLEAMSGRTRRAHAAAPRRLVVFFTPNGTIRENWISPLVTSPTQFTLGRILAPLEAHKQNIVVLEGVDNVSSTKGPGDDHMRGMGSMLTGTELLPGSTQGGAGVPAGLAGGLSVDQHMVQTLKPGTRFPSLELGVQAGSQGTVWGYSNYRAPGQALPLDNSPRSIFDRIFSDTLIAGSDNSAALRLRAQRKSVLDAVRESYRVLNPKLGAADKKRLDQHLTTVDELQQRMFAQAPTEITAKSCLRPSRSMLDGKGNDNFPIVGKAQMDLLVMALACDLTRAATIQWSNSVGQPKFSWLPTPLTRGHHDYSHDPDKNPDGTPHPTVEVLTLINIWYAEQFAYLLSEMKKIPEDGGTMLDNSLVLWCNELSRGNAHSHPDMPFVLAGGAGGRLKTGRYLKFAGTVPHNNLLVSILNAFDIPATTFGNPAYCTGALAGLI